MGGAGGSGAPAPRQEGCGGPPREPARFGDSARLTDAQFHKLTCIAQAGGFWERER